MLVKRTLCWQKNFVNPWRPSKNNNDRAHMGRSDPYKTSDLLISIFQFSISRLSSCAELQQMYSGSYFHQIVYCLHFTQEYSLVAEKNLSTTHRCDGMQRVPTLEKGYRQRKSKPKTVTAMLGAELGGNAVDRTLKLSSYVKRCNSDCP